MAKITKEEAFRILSNVPEENKFWCNNGSVLTNLQELETALKIMSNETFSYHANQERNDFSNWIKDIIKDERLANDLVKAKSKNNALKKLRNRLSTLKRIKR